MDCISLTTSRRRFLKNATWTGLALSGLSSKGAESKSTDPFDALPKSVWERARNNGLVMIHRPAPEILSSETRIVPLKEPGKALTIEGQVFAPDGVTPTPGITVYAYNTDAEGYYGADHKEYPPRLYGWMRTNDDGRFELHTILPGHYPEMHVPAHVHFTVWGGSYPPQWTEELRFEGDPYITPDMLALSKAKGEFGSIQPLTSTRDGVLHCRFNIRLQRETNFH